MDSSPEVLSITEIIGHFGKDGSISKCMQRNGEEKIHIFMIGGEFWVIEKTGRALMSSRGEFKQVKLENV